MALPSGPEWVHFDITALSRQDVSTDRKRTVLGVNVLPEDVAQAVLYFASEARSGKSTGNVLNVDGGVSAAFPR